MPKNELLQIDPDAFRAYFNLKPFLVRSALVDHPLFTLPSLVELARRLPKEFVEYNGGNLPVGARPEETPQTGLSAEETIRRIEECGSWLVLKRVEQIPEYRALLDACLDEVEAHARPLVKRMFHRQGFIFVSSPNAVTPFHMDPEHNFLLQIRGKKTVHIWDRDDRFVVSEQDLETFHSSFVHRNLAYREDFLTTAHVVPLAPGQGLHFPVTVPHWVKNGDNVSISFSVTFRTDVSEDRELLYRTNARLRRWGLTPTPVGKAPLSDLGKTLLARTFLKARSYFD